MAVVQADWNDLVAAMEVAPARVELAVVSMETTEDRVRFELISITDEPGEMVATRPASTRGASNPTRADAAITLTARIGRYGDARRERELLDAVVRRLDQLHGKATAPLDW